jgi:hypothetical protein
MGPVNAPVNALRARESALPVSPKTALAAIAPEIAAGVASLRPVAPPAAEIAEIAEIAETPVPTGSDIILSVDAPIHTGPLMGGGAAAVAGAPAVSASGLFSKAPASPRPTSAAGAKAASAAVKATAAGASTPEIFFFLRIRTGPNPCRNDVAFVSEIGLFL